MGMAPVPIRARQFTSDTHSRPSRFSPATHSEPAPMKRTSFRSWPCSLARSVDLLGDWWTPLVLREAFFGARRFDEFQQALGIGRNVLAARLRRLVAEGLLERRLHQERPA